MWFKNLVVYRLPADWSLSAAELEDALSRRPLQHCAGYDMQTRGWVAPAYSERFLHTVNGHHLFALGVERKLLPASIVNQETKERAVKLEAEQGYPVGRKQMRDLKLRVADELRARAFARRSTVRAWMDTEQGWLVIDSASVAKAEELVETLRDTLGTFAVTLFETERTPSTSMSAWLTASDVPGRFNIEQDLELQATNDTKAIVRYVRHSLEGREIQAHLSSGKTPTRLGLSWNSRLSFVLTAELQVKRVQFLDMVKDNAESQGETAAEEQFDIDFTLMSGELRQMLKELTQTLGGEARSAQSAQAAQPRPYAPAPASLPASAGS